MAPSIMVIDTNTYKDDKVSIVGTRIGTTATSKNTQTSIVIISKTGTLSECLVDPEHETTVEQLTVLLSKKCGNRNHNDFSCYHTWKYKNKKKFDFMIGNEKVIPKYIYVDVWGKTDGRAGYENKYEMPPPIDELIFYGNIALVARADKENAINLTAKLWEIIYEKLFGGFEDLAATAVEDENEIDELDSIPAHKKTNNGYLKDGFVVDDDSEDKTPRCKKTKKSKVGKKNKSESTESEFITETETESGTPPSETPLNSESDADAEADPDVAEYSDNIDGCDDKNKCSKKKITVKPSVPVVKPKRTPHAKKPANIKSKKGFEEPPVAQESEDELSEEEYV